MACFQEKKRDLLNYPIFNVLREEDATSILLYAEKYSFTISQLYQLTDAARDLQMWQKPPLQSKFSAQLEQVEPRNKKKLFHEILIYYESIKNKDRDYSNFDTPKLTKKNIQLPPPENLIRKVSGDCPVSSDKTMCCKLKTIDVVESCPYNCSYCTISTFYDKKISFDNELQQKLKMIEIDKNKLYHFGTGQSSDSLVWGNANHILEDLFHFLQMHENIYLELKTKSSNIAPLLQLIPPWNLVVSWTLSPDIIIKNEEHFTSTLMERIEAARSASDSGVMVAFHFHPIIPYAGWKEDYKEMSKIILSTFKPEEIAFLSFGTLTFIKPVLRDIRLRGVDTLVTQFESHRDPHGRLTESDEKKNQIYKYMIELFSTVKGSIFHYLCMEKESIWKESLGFCYSSNEEFEKCFAESVFLKLNRRRER